MTIQQPSAKSANTEAILATFMSQTSIPVALVRTQQDNFKHFEKRQKAKAGGADLLEGF